MGGFGTIISLILLIAAIGILVFIARELDTKKKKKLSGIILLLLSILFLLAQVSFLFYPQERYKNWCGLFGHYSSYGLFWLFGLYIFIIPSLLGYAGYIMAADTEKRIRSHLLYFIPIGVIADTLLSLFLTIPIAGMRSGGVLGYLISDFLVDFFGHVGTYIILGFSIVVVILMMVREKVFPRIKGPEQVEKSKKPPKPQKKKKKEPEAGAPAPVQAKIERKPPAEIDFKQEFLDILQVPTQKYGIDADQLKRESEILSKRLAEFDVTGKVVAVESGPVISRFEFQPDPGIKVNRIANLDNDLALALKATRIRVVAPIPGKSAVGIEVPNRERSLVYLKNGLIAEGFENHPSPLAIVLGEDITGMPICEDIAVMPHMLIAGTTGSGKSVCINSLIASILYHSTPEDVRFLMIDPKRLELPMYNPIPHLMRRAITEPKEAVGELEKLVAIMEMRYRHFAREGVRDIDGYNEKMRKKGGKNKPYLVVVVDELADLMLTAPSEIEENITRLAQMSRAVGIHLVLATQRPSVDVITGLIKANFPCRIAFQVASKTDSRTILDMNGAESLLGRGDMLFLPPGKGTPVRLHGAYIAADEVSGISQLIARIYLREKLKDVEGDIDEIITSIIDEELWTIFTDTKDVAFDEKRRALSNIITVEKIDEIIDSGYYPKLPETEVEEVVEEQETDMTVDPLFEEAARLVFRHQVASVSLLQRRLNLGYARAGRIVDQLEAAGVVEPFQGSKSRKVLIEREDELNEIVKKYSTP
ncbi:MAG: DNA translocase FtsK 4TM domain-containing protein [candidate division WOR-3 bacterium]|nr:MAG: DNA translocase FtsK 4TM domain-containing protein [candidate division WOR-3 bacterium]